MRAPAPSPSFRCVRSALWSAPSASCCSSSAGSAIAWGRCFGLSPWFHHSPSSTASITPGRKLGPAASFPGSSCRFSLQLFPTSSEESIFSTFFIFLMIKYGPKRPRRGQRGLSANLNTHHSRRYRPGPRDLFGKFPFGLEGFRIPPSLTFNCRLSTYPPVTRHESSITLFPCPLSPYPTIPLLSVQGCFHWRGYDFANAFAQRWHVFFCESLGLDGVVQKNHDFPGPEPPLARPVMLKGTNQAHGYDGNTELLRDAEAAVLELIHVPVARPLGFGKNDEAGAAIDGVLREPPHALQIRRPPDIRDGDVAKALHQPAVRGNLEVRFQLPSADKLRDRAVEHERIEKIDVVRHEERSAVGIEAGSSADLDLRTGKKRDAAAETALQPIMLARIEEDAEKDERWHNEKEMQAADDPKNRAAEHQPCPFHM